MFIVLLSCYQRLRGDEHRNFQAPQEPPAKPHTAAQVILVSGMLSPPTATEGGFTFTLPLAPGIPLFIAEERLLGWATVYRGTVASAGSAEDLATLEDVMPMWLLEYLLLGRAPQVAIIKIQFALLPGEGQRGSFLSSSIRE